MLPPSLLPSFPPPLDSSFCPPLSPCVRRLFVSLFFQRTMNHGLMCPKANKGASSGRLLARLFVAGLRCYRAPKQTMALVRDIYLPRYLSLDSDATVFVQPPPPCPRHGVGCCICWWVDWLVRWLASLPVECLVVGWYISRLLVGCLVAGWFVGWLVVWLVGCIYILWCVVWCGFAWCDIW